MKIAISIGLMSVVGMIALGAPAFADTVPSSSQSGLERIQYNNPYPDQRYDQSNQNQRNDQYYPDQRGNYPDQGYNGNRGPAPFRWRPGQVVPGQAMNFVVNDWEERGLSRPPGGHQWFRIRQQFVLIRIRDRMIARILTFD